MVRDSKRLPAGVVAVAVAAVAFAVGMLASRGLREAWYLGVLRSGPAAGQGVAARQLLAMGSPWALPLLVRYARSRADNRWRIDGGPADPGFTDVRSELVSGLARLGGLAALRELVEGVDLGSVAILVRVCARHVEESAEIEKFLAEMASHANVDVGYRACYGLLNCRRTLTPEACEGLLKFATAEPQDDSRTEVAGRIAGAQFPVEWMIPRLLGTLKSTNWKHRWHAGRILGELTTQLAERDEFRDVALEALSSALDIEPNPEVQETLRRGIDSLREKAEARTGGSGPEPGGGPAAPEGRAR